MQIRGKDDANTKKIRRTNYEKTMQRLCKDDAKTRQIRCKDDVNIRKYEKYEAKTGQIRGETNANTMQRRRK